LYSEIRIEGLETLDYLDNLFQKERFTEQGDAITFESEVNIVGYIYYVYNMYIFKAMRHKSRFFFRSAFLAYE
jgi:hypothetical protein